MYEMFTDDDPMRSSDFALPADTPGRMAWVCIMCGEVPRHHVTDDESCKHCGSHVIWERV